MTPRRIIEAALNEGRSKLLEHESLELLRYYGIPTPKAILVSSAEEAARYADEVGYPVVLKIVSPDIVHKTDIGGVKLNLVSREDVEKASIDMLRTVSIRAPSARIIGFLIQQMVPPGLELIVGGIRDSVFGPIVMLGLGGLFVEILQDVVFRIAPLTFEDALEMIGELKFSKIISGYRGQQPIRRERIADILVRTSRVLEDNEEIQTLDINPVIAYSDSIIAVDARIIVREKR
ncbi:MAG: acetate--CoA ligase family protein [Ignisphaera sp.]|nr:acetate--CoA ligase family protein [Ignisphaera sp.]MDW8085983.1 acetate--CoA ligase family protein [Ignisphaera sp.]